jgi:hypothetical protein
MDTTNTAKTYHCSTFTDVEGIGVGTSTTLCGVDTASQSWDYPLDFVECKVSPLAGRTKCKECANHPDLPMALLGDLDDE